MTLPAVDAALCRGSGDCVALCPTGCLEMAGPLPWLPRPRDCIACGLCELACPTGAIRVPEPNPPRPAALQ